MGKIRRAAVVTAAALGIAAGACCQAGAEQMPTGDRYTNSIGMELVRVEPGTFTMGFGEGKLPEAIASPVDADGTSKIWVPEEGDYDGRPNHMVRISKPFYMGMCEVTNEQYEMFDQVHVYLRGKRAFSVDNDEAVVFVSWHDAKAFCDWLSRKEGLPYRLPTEAEWEYACRAGTTTHYSTGDSLPAAFIKNPGNSWYPDPTRSRGWDEVAKLHMGQTPANPWGLHDMHGNVEEWCEDWYGPYQAGDQVDPVGRSDGLFKVTRGGSHGTVAFYLRSANRMGTLPEDRHWFIGFRVVLGELPTTAPVPPEPKPLYQQNVQQEVPADLGRRVDANTPYFRGPRPFIKIAEGSFGPLFSNHNHHSAITECPNGDLLAMWYTTVTERGRELAIAASRLRYGAEEWEPASPCWDVPDRNDHAPALWYDGDKTIYHFNGFSTAATWGPLAIMVRTSTDNGATWSRPRIIVPEHTRRHQVVESVFRTREGYLVLPADANTRGDGGTALHISRDGGDTWEDAGGTIAGIHAGVAQTDDGNLIALARGDPMTFPGPTAFFPFAHERREGALPYMPMSISRDMGKTWVHQASPFPPIDGGQRLALMTLREGPLFLASFAREEIDDGPVPPVMITDASGTKRQILGLYAALSYDGGKTWPVIKPVSDEPKGYMSVCQAQDGVIHVTTSKNHYAFNLKWLETPAPALEESR